MSTFRALTSAETALLAMASGKRPLAPSSCDQKTLQTLWDADLVDVFEGCESEGGSGSFGGTVTVTEKGRRVWAEQHLKK